MQNWTERAKELLAVLEQHPTVPVQTAEVRERFKAILEGATDATYLVRHYREPRAVVMSVETFEAMRQLALIVSGLVNEAEPREAPGAAAEAGVDEEAWSARIDEGIKAARAAGAGRRQFKRQPAAAR
jgi:PHD/YefM family antitoxin component YafN of YafNO toxin-antitoxin module